MTPAELVENGFNAIDTGLMCLSVYLTIVSGYLIVARVAGMKLTRSQIYTVSFLFISFSSLLILGTVSAMQAGMELSALTRDYTSWMDSALELGASGIGFLQVVGILLALKFMLDERKSREPA